MGIPVCKWTNEKSTGVIFIYDFHCTIYALFITDPLYFDTLNVALVEFLVPEGTLR